MSDAIKGMTAMTQEELDEHIAKMREADKQINKDAIPPMTIGEAMGETPSPFVDPKTYTARYYGMEQIHAKQINRLADEGNAHAVTLRNSGVLVSANGPRTSGGYVVATGETGEADRIYYLIQKINQWGLDRKLIREEGCTALAQMKKLKEEVQEIEDAILTGDEIEMVDGIGDSMVVIIQLCRLTGVTVEEALERAYAQIKYRKGYMQDGVFIKETK